MKSNNVKNLAVFLVAAVLLLALPLVLQTQGNAWVRIVDIALLSDHPGAFKVVHVALGLVSMALAARCDAELNGTPRLRRRVAA